MASLQKRLNSTGRQRIKRERVTVLLHEGVEDQIPWAEAKINLGNMRLPPDATVAFEAYYRSSSMRFPCGTVAVPIVPERMYLTDIDQGGAIRFRILVIAPDGSGKILAAADGLRPSDEEDGSDRQPLLVLRERNLGSELWRIDIDERSGPILLVTNTIPGFAARLKKSPLLQGLVFPHALRTILQKLPPPDDENDDNWSDSWRTFLGDLGVSTEPEDDEPDTVHAWVEEAAKRFCEAKMFAVRARESGETLEISHD